MFHSPINWQHPALTQGVWPLTISISLVLRHLHKVAKAIISFVVSPSICMEQTKSHWMDFHEIVDWGLLTKSLKKIQFQLKSDKNNRHFKQRPMYIYDNILPNFFWTRKLRK